MACFEVCAEQTSAPAAAIWGSQRAIGSHVLDHVYGIQRDFSSLFLMIMWWIMSYLLRSGITHFLFSFPEL